MKHAGQRAEGTFREHYAPNNSGADGQASYLGEEIRSIVNDRFRGISLFRNLNLWQSFPAEKSNTSSKQPGKHRPERRTRGFEREERCGLHRPSKGFVCAETDTDCLRASQVAEVAAVQSRI